MIFSTSAAHRAGFFIAFAGIIALVSLGGCGDRSTEPGRDHPPGQLPRRIEIGDTVVTSLVMGRDSIPAVHSFVARSNGMASVLVDVRKGSIVVAVVDSASARLLSRAEYRAGPSAGAASMPPFPLEGTRVYTVSIWTSESDSVAFRYVPFMVRTAPEELGAAIDIGDVVDGEPLDSLADIDEFTFTGAKGDEIIVFAQGLDASDSSSRLSVRVAYTDTAMLVRYITAAPHDPDPESHTTRTIVLPADGQYTVTVTAGVQPTYDPPPPYVGTYRIEVTRIDRAPETQAATITPGDTIEGAIERVGDIDEFRFDASAGAQFNVFFQASAPGDSSLLRLDLPTADGTRVDPVEARGSDGLALAENPTGTFTAVDDGAITIRVVGKSDADDLDRAPYRLLVYRIDSLPESESAQTLSSGDTATDAMDLPGDVDELPLLLSTTSPLNMELWRGAPSRRDAPTFRILDAGRREVLRRNVPADPDSAMAYGTGPISIPAGSYTLQVLGEWTGKGAYRGPWRVVLHPSDRLPESHDVSVAPGDTVEEGNNPLADLDYFEMSVQRGDQYQLYLQSPVVGVVLDGAPKDAPSPYPLIHLYASSTGEQPLLESARTNRIDIQHDGVFVLSAAVASTSTTPPPYPPYRFVVTRFSGAVEYHAATISVGDTVDDEKLDVLGDLDEFTLVGTPGSEATVLFWPLTVQVFDLETRKIITEMASSGAWQATGRFMLPSSGRVGVRVMESGRSGTTGYRWVGPYSFRVMRVDRAPEVSAAVFSIGDIVSGESVEFSGDVDEFTFSAAAGDRLRAFFDVPNGTTYFRGLTLDLSPAGSDSVLGSVSLVNSAPELDTGTPVVTIPASGSYTVRVRSSDERQASAVDQPTAYRFQVRREP